MQTFPSRDKVISNSKFKFNSVSTDDELLDVPLSLDTRVGEVIAACDKVE